MKPALSFLYFTVLFLTFSCETRKTYLSQTGEYLGQASPGDQPQPFAPGIVATGIFTRDVAMTPDGKEFYFCVALANYAYSTIMVTRQVNGKWTTPQVMDHMDNPKIMNLEPCIAPDGSRFLFLSNRPHEGETEGDEDIWAMERSGNGWGEPFNLGNPICTEHAEFFPSLTRDGTLYFTRSEKGSRASFIYRSKMVEGRYTQPEKCAPQVNCGVSHFNAFIDPDERYIIVPVAGREDSYGGIDYYIVFRNEDDTWSDPVNMGDKVNTAGSMEYSPYVSGDGKYFFFMTSRVLPREAWPEPVTYSFIQRLHNMPDNGNSTVYWVETAFIEAFRQGRKRMEPIESDS